MKLDSLINPGSGYILLSQNLEDGRNVTRFVFSLGKEPKPEQFRSAVTAISQLLIDNPELIPLFESDRLGDLVKARKYLVINENVVCFTKRGGITSSSQLDYVDTYFSSARFTSPVKCHRGEHVFEKEYAELWIKRHQEKGMKESCPGCGEGTSIFSDGSSELKIDARLQSRAEYDRTHRDRTVQRELKQKLTGLIRENGRLTVEITTLKANIKKLTDANQTMRDGIMALPSDRTPLGRSVTALQSQVRSLPQVEIVDEREVVGPRPPVGEAPPPPSPTSPQAPPPPVESPRLPTQGLGEAPPPPSPTSPQGLGEAPPPPSYRELKLCGGEKFRVAVSMLSSTQRDAAVQTAYHVLGLQKDIRHLTKGDVKTAYKNAEVRYAGNKGLLTSAKNAQTVLLKLTKKK